MRLPISYLIDQMEECLQLVDSGMIDGDFSVSSPVFLTGEAKLEKSRLYIGRADQINEQICMELGAFVICSGKPARLMRNLVYIKEGISLESVFNQLQEIFYRADQLEEDLNRYLYEKADIFKILDRVGSFIQYSIGLMTPDFRYIHVYVAEGEEYPYCGDIFDPSGDLLAERVAALKTDPYYKAVEKYPSAYTYATALESAPYYCINLIVNDAYVGRIIVVDRSKEMASWLGFFLEKLRYYILPGFLRMLERSDEGSAKIELVEDLISGKPVQKERLERLLEQMDWKEEGMYILAGIQLNESDIENRVQTYFSRKLETTLGNAVCVPTETGMKILAYIGSKAEKISVFDRVLTEQMREYDFRVGLSRKFCGITNAKFAAKQAELALAYGIKPDSSVWKCTFDKVVFGYLLEMCCYDIPAEYIAHPALLMLDEIDRKTGSVFAETLYTYLKNGMNMARSANELFIHRGTMIYRMERIQKITGLDLTDLEEVTYLLISYALLK